MSSRADTRQSMAISPTRRDTLRLVSIALIVVGLVISGYLSYSKLTATPTICAAGETFNCEVVQTSIYADLMGIPIAYLGFLTYVVLLALVLLEKRVSLLEQYGQMLVFGITLFAFLFSVWLVYIQAVRLQAFCAWCLGHELTMTVLFVVSGLRLWRSMNPAEDDDL